MTVPHVSALPTPPSRADAANFAARADTFLGDLPTMATEMNAVADFVNDASTAASAAAASAVATPATQATSTTSLPISIGSKTLTIQSGKSIVKSMWVAIMATADGTKWMTGPVVSYDTGTGQLVVDVQRINGSGTVSAWTVVGTNPMISDTAPRALAAGSTIKDATGADRAIGFLGSPVIAVTGAHTLSLADVGCTLELGAGAVITVPLHSAVAFNPGDIILLREMAGVTKSITPASGVTLRQSGTSNSGGRTLKAYGEGSIKFTGTNDVVFCNGDLT